MKNGEEQREGGGVRYALAEGEHDKGAGQCVGARATRKEEDTGGLKLFPPEFSVTSHFI